jgi:hypothetical protein
MKNYTDSDYAANKYNKGIVYRFADEVVVVTLTDYLAENPGHTAADFGKLKAFSDNDYRERDRLDYQEMWKNVPIDKLEETELCSVPSSEDIFLSELDAIEENEQYRQKVELAKQVLDKLTEVQRRRYLLHVVNGLSTWKIAEIEGVNQSKIMKSLDATEKKIKKVLSNG